MPPPTAPCPSIRGCPPQMFHSRMDYPFLGFKDVCSYATYMWYQEVAVSGAGAGVGACCEGRISRSRLSSRREPLPPSSALAHSLAAAELQLLPSRRQQG